METLVPEPPVETTGDLDLGVVLGQLQAFSTVAARCTAAQASLLVRMREQKVYKHITEHWEKFCPEYLKMSRAEADKRIALWNEFGASYFDVSQYAPVSAEVYRLMEPSVRNGAIHLDDQVILLDPANAQKVAGVVAEFRRRRRSAAASKRRPKTSVFHEIEDVQENIDLLKLQFHSIFDRAKGGPHEPIVQTTLYNLAAQLVTDLRAFQFKCGRPA